MRNERTVNDATAYVHGALVKMSLAQNRTDTATTTTLDRLQWMHQIAEQLTNGLEHEIEQERKNVDSHNED